MSQSLQNNYIENSKKNIKFVILSENTSKSNKKFKRKTKTIEFKIQQNFWEYINLENIKDEIVENFRILIEKAIVNEKENNLITLELNHESLSTPIYIGHRKIKDFLENISIIFHILEKYTQSNKSLLNNGNIELTITIIEMS